MTDERQIERPDLVVPDTGPLIHLAQIEALDLLHQVGGRVVVTDMVALEATADPSKPGAVAIRDWLEAGQAPGSNRPVAVERTDVGRAFLAARKAEPEFRWRGAGELAIVEWLGTYVDAAAVGIVVLYENGRVPRFVRETGLDLATDVLTTRAFLQLAERRGLIDSAEDHWRRIVAVAPTANPDIAIMMHRRPPT